MWGRHRKRIREISPDEIFIDSSNLPEFDKDQFEGRLERPLDRRSIVAAGILMSFVFMALIARAGELEIVKGVSYAKKAMQNQIAQQIIFADRSVITDRQGRALAHNERANVTDDFATRVYDAYRGLAHVVGYVKPPAKDSNGIYYREGFIGMDGVEKAYDKNLAGQNGVKLSETDAHGKIISETVVQDPVPGKRLVLSIDAQVTQGLYDAIAQKAQQSKFQGGAGVIMDVTTGEILALTSYPEYSQQSLAQGDAAAIASYNSDPQQPFLNRAINGLYAPGSIVKPIMGIAALTQGVIDENKQILSTGSISVPNPFDPAHPSVFKDWRANGWVDLRHAIAVSSDVYFYEVGGGFQNQPGIGIDAIGKYLRMFGFGSPTGLSGFAEPAGTIPSPGWKAKNFPGDPWRIGDTYHTAIGQYGVQITPLQAVREAAAIANGGVVLTPTFTPNAPPQVTQLQLPQHAIDVVKEGMRLGVTSGIAQPVNFDFVHIAAKTGTAQVGSHNQFVNSWMIGFFPYEHPRYAYAVVLEKGPATEQSGTTAAVASFFNWMQQNAPQYLQ